MRAADEMIAWRLERQAPIGTAPLVRRVVPRPVPAEDELLLRVHVCGICRTDLHVIEGDLPSRGPVVPGHQIVGEVVAIGAAVRDFRPGARVGVGWVRRTCGVCPFCRDGRENLCPDIRFTGYDADGGFAEYATVPAAFAHRLPDGVPDDAAAPLLCAGLIGYRALLRSRVQPRQRLGIYGFGSSAHVTLQVARHRGCEVFVATRGEVHRQLARTLGAAWVGDATETFPSKVDAAIVFAPAGELVPVALRALERGGTVALAGIYMSDIPSLAYGPHLFHEKTLCSVTGNTRADARAFFGLAAEIPIRPRVQVFALDDVNEALRLLAEDRIEGSGVVRVC